MTWQPPFRRRARRTVRQVKPGLDSFERRVVPTVVINGTAGNDLITSGFYYDNAAASYRGEVRLNGAVVYSFLGDLYTSPTPSIFLPEALEVNGLGGNDRIDLTALRDPAGQSTPIVVHGGPGNDSLVGGSGHDVLYGDAGADSLNGGIDEDTLVGDDADTAFVGGGGIDVLTFENFGGTLRATPDAITMNGNRLTAGSGRFVQIAAFDVTGSNGPDTIDLSQFPTFLANVRGRGGNDIIRVNAGGGEVDGGPGDDLIVNTSTTAAGFTVLGGDGADTIRVNAGFTAVDAGPGDDTVDARGVAANGSNAGVNVAGGPGNDTVFGSSFADYLDGGDDDDQVSGGGGDDFLTGGAGADSITGGDDADTFSVDAADVRWAGGRGFDTVYIDGGFRSAVVTNGSATLDGRTVSISGLEVLNITGTPLDDVLDASRSGGLVNLTGLEGRDVLRAGSGGSFLDGGEGDDQLFGGSGNDALYGGPGADRLSAGAGSDELTADQADTLVQAGSGFDYVSLTATGQHIVAADHQLTVDGKVFPLADAESVSYNLFGTAGNDTLDSTGYTQALAYSAGDGDDVVRTGPGDDTVDAGTGDDVVDAGAGNDVVTDIDGHNTLIGGPGNDSLTGGFGPDVLDGGGDNDVLFGGNDDVLRGGSGDDVIYTTTLAASIDAGAGYDAVYVQGAFSSSVVLTDTSWNDSGHVVTQLGVEVFDMVTGISDDTVDAAGFSGFLSLNDSGGNNLVKVGSGGSGVYLRGNPLFDFNNTSTVIGGSGSDTIYADTGHNFFYGNGGDDYLSVAFGGSYLDGGAGNDILSGGTGDDTLIGGAGDDDLRGNAGTDSVVGGTGADRFTRDVDPVIAAAEAVLWDYSPGEGDVAVDPN